jgi:hypothetical protein
MLDCKLFFDNNQTARIGYVGVGSFAVAGGQVEGDTIWPRDGAFSAISACLPLHAVCQIEASRRTGKRDRRASGAAQCEACGTKIGGEPGIGFEDRPSCAR